MEYGQVVIYKSKYLANTISLLTAVMKYLTKGNLWDEGFTSVHSCRRQTVGMGKHGKGLNPRQQQHTGGCWLHGVDQDVESYSFKKGKPITHKSHSQSSATHFCWLPSISKGTQTF